MILCFAGVGDVGLEQHMLIRNLETDLSNLCRIRGELLGNLKVLIQLAVMMLLSAAPVFAGETLTIATGEWPPYSGKNLPAHGLCSDIVTEAFKAQGIECNYEFYPWKRALFLVQSGSVGCSVPWSKRILDKGTVLYSDSLLEHRLSFFYMKKKFTCGVEWKDLTELKMYRIGVPRGYLQEKTFKAKGLTIDVIDSFRSGIKMLQKGYIDLLLENSVVGEHIINTELPEIKDDIGEEWTKIEPEAAIALFSRKSKGAGFFRSKLNKGLKVIRKNGTYSRIMKKHGFVAFEQDK